MSRSQRLLSLLQLLRQYRNPVSAKTLADTLDISVRSIYRDIETLRQQGADIKGEAGIGYVLHDGFILPPLMFTIEEIEALIIGSRWVQTHGDENLVNHTNQALTKIRSVIPNSHQSIINDNTLFVPAFSRKSQPLISINAKLSETIRHAIRLEKTCLINYQDGKQTATERKIKPFGLSFFDEVQVIMAWCCLRNAFRHFRVDRVLSLEMSKQTYIPNKQQLLSDWQRDQGIDLTVIQNF